MVAATLVRHHRSQKSKAQHLRHGPQVAVERATGRPSAGRVSGQGRSAVEGSARKTGWRVRHLRSNRRHALAILGGKTWAEGGHSDSRRRLRRALGRDRGRLPHRRHGERHRHLDLHHRHHAVGESGARSLRRGARQRASLSAPESKPGSPPWEISSMRSLPAPAPM